MRRSSQYKDDDDDDPSSHHDHVPLAASESAAAAGQPAPQPRWSEKLGAYLKIMAHGKKAATNKDVAAYYKHQRETLKRLIEVNHLQEVEEDEEAEKKEKDEEATKENKNAGPTAGTPTTDSNEPTGSIVVVDKKKKTIADEQEGDTKSNHSTLSSNQSNDDDDDEEAAGGSYIATGSLLLNICLLGIKVYAAISSGSLIVLASLLDSALDLVSGFILVVVEWKIAAAAGDPEYPIGTHHWESIGTLVFSSFMFVASTRLIEDGATTLAEIGKASADISTPTFIVIGCVVFTKAIAFMICRAYKSSMIRALADDHRNDVLTNSIGLAGLFLTSYVSPYFDPSISLLTCAWLLRVWGGNIYEQAMSLSSKMADKDYLNELTFLARNCDPRLVAVDTVRAVTSGSGYIVEIDLVLPPDMSLREAHDIGEKFQMFLERHETLNVARAYLHLDWEVDHDPKKHQ